MIALISIEEAAIRLAEQLDLATPDGESSAEFRLGCARIGHHNKFEQRLVDMVNDGRLMARDTSGLSRSECKGIATPSTLALLEEARARLIAEGSVFVEATPGINPALGNAVDDQGKDPLRISDRATQQKSNSGLSRKEILSGDWPLIGKFNADSLGRALSDVPNWLKHARVARGAPGKGSSSWNPALVAACILEKGHAKAPALTQLIRKQFPEWLNQWEEYNNIA